MIEALKDRLTFLKYGLMLLAMLTTVLVYAFLGYLAISYAYATGGQVVGFVIAASVILLTIALGRRISSA